MAITDPTAILLDIDNVIPNAQAGSISSYSDEYKLMEKWREFPRALMNGMGGWKSDLHGVLDKATKWLPKFSGESEDNYEFRRDFLTTVPPLYPDSVDDVVNALMPRDLTLGENVPLVIRGDGESGGIWEDIDRHGMSGNQFLARSARQAVAEGIDFTLVDYPSRFSEFGGQLGASPGTGVREPRPYWTQIPAINVLETRWDIFDSLILPTRIKVLEIDTVMDGEWGVRDIVKIRVYRRGNPSIPRRAFDRNEEEGVFRYASCSVHVMDFEDKTFSDVPDQVFYFTPPSVPRPSDEQEVDFVEIPIYPTYGHFVEPFVGKPFLLYTAELIKKLLILQSDKTNIEHFANTLTMVINGMERNEFDQYNKSGGEIHVGADQRIHVEGVPGNPEPIYYLEHSGNSIPALKQSVDDLKEEIRDSVNDTSKQRASGVELATVRFFKEGRRVSRLKLLQLRVRDAAFAAMRRTALYYGTTLVPSDIEWPDVSAQMLVDLKDKREFTTRAREVGSMSVRTASEQAVRLGLVETRLTAEEFGEREVERMLAEGAMAAQGDTDESLGRGAAGELSEDSLDDRQDLD